MATFVTRWLLSILLVDLANCVAPTGPPARPSSPECYIPCDDSNCWENIHCTWDSRPDPQIPTDYSLHWANIEEGHVNAGTSLSGLIHRVHFSSHGELRVWVQAKNQHGSARSQEVVFNTADIVKPPPPKVTLSQQDTLEIYWASTCDQLELSVGLCNVRRRTEADQVWFEEEDGFYASYILDSLQSCTVYEFQVRCACSTGLMSDWTEIYSMSSPETVPVGELDVWRDCGISAASFDCALTWKRLPQACGLILGYEVTLVYNGGTKVLMNVSTAEPVGPLVCDERQCRFTSSLNGVSSVSVSAYNAHGATVPSYLAMPVPGKEKNDQTIDLKITEEYLSVSWAVPSQLSDNLKEYVVQYKQAGCPPGQGFDWVKVNKSQTTTIFKGQFKKHTLYQVSLFTVSYSSEVHHLSSAVGYSLQGTPPRVPSFKVFSMATTHATVLWEPVPLFEQRGVILYYQIGVDRQNVYNVSASPQHGNRTFKLLHLNPGQAYEVWIRAVTAAGPGENVTTRFSANNHEDYAHLTPALVGISVAVMICFIVLFSACRGEGKACPLFPPCLNEKVPDPRNSHIFRQKKFQITDPVAWIRIPVYEPHPKISLLEVVEIQSWALKTSEKTSNPDGLNRPAVEDDQKKDDITEECHRKHRRDGREEYSKMVDSDEERDREEKEEDREDCWSSSGEEPSTSGYEKHFMPSALEILKV
ncbi:interleukin 12 receptor, beta 2a, like [Pempheris klunzingeri]|uniref:interleukin 12 receptor, beta 2a, like n=1 Tax=Pempheris klunzingeri TaxID=3127111 RepID=UPI00398027F2